MTRPIPALDARWTHPAACAPDGVPASCGAPLRSADPHLAVRHSSARLLDERRGGGPFCGAGGGQRPGDDLRSRHRAGTASFPNAAARGVRATRSGRPTSRWRPTCDKAFRPFDALISDLRALRGPRARCQLLREHLFPPPHYLRAARPRMGSGPLPWLYARRIVRGVSHWFRVSARVIAGPGKRGRRHAAHSRLESRRIPYGLRSLRRVDARASAARTATFAFVPPGRACTRRFGTARS